MPQQKDTLQVTLVPKEESGRLWRLLQKYLCEFSKWEKTDVEEDGDFSYPYFSCYWQEKNRWPLLFWYEGHMAGFALVNDYPESGIKTDYVMGEFFILPKYRQKGLGSQAAGQIFTRFAGSWQLKYHPHNQASVGFWERLAARYAKDGVKREEHLPKARYEDGTDGVVLFFTT